MRALVAFAALALLAPLASAQRPARAEREAPHRAPTYGEAEYHDTERTDHAPRRHAPTYGEASVGQRTMVRSERIVTRYYDGGEPRQHVERHRDPAPQWIRDEARAFRAVPQVRTARRAHLDGVRYDDGSHYRGDLDLGLPHGQGRMTYADGSSYDGAFVDGIPHGRGTFRTASGDVLTGTFEDGVLANGSADYAAGHRYEGAFLAGRPHGQGTIDYADGSSYEGAFQSGRPDGWGVYRDAYGDRFEGSWNRGRMDSDDGYPEGAEARERRTERPRRMRSDRRRSDRDGAWR